MAVNLDRLRAKLESLNNPGKRGESNLWKPPQKDGEKRQIRLVAYPFSEDPFVELFFHYGIGKDGKGSILCPNKNGGDHCPICEMGRGLWQSEDARDKEMAKLCLPTQRYYALVTDRGDPNASWKYWGFGITVYKKFLETLLNPRLSHMMNNDSGIDCIVSTAMGKKKFRETTVELCNSDTPLFKDPEKIKAFMASVKPITEIFKPTTAEDIEKALNDWLNSTPSENPEAESSETTRGGGVKEEKTSKENNESVQELEDVFDRIERNNKGK